MPALQISSLPVTTAEAECMTRGSGGSSYGENCIFPSGGAPAAKIVARISNRVRLYFCTSPVPLLQIEICSLTRLKNTGKRLSRGFTVGVKLRASVEVGLDAPPKAFSGYPLALPSKEAGTHVAAVAALSPV